jgi:hypothetical protein
VAKKSAAEEQQDKLINIQAQQLAAQVANWAAQLEFQKERLRLLELPEMQGKLQVDIDRLAWEKTQGTWERAFKEAALTGTYNGQPTLEWLTQQAQLTGVLNGSQTLQGKLTDAQIRQMNESMRLANDEFIANTTGYIGGRKTFDREKFEAGQAQDAWKFLATLTGPANAFKQARAISSMPGGMSDLMSAWAGQYSMPGAAPVGSGGRAGFEGLMMGFGGNYDYRPAAPVTGPTGYTGDGMYQPVQGTPLPAPPYPTYTPPPAPGHGDISGGAGGGAPAPGGPAAPGAPAAPTPTQAVSLSDPGFMAWLYKGGTGFVPGDPTLAGRVDEFRSLYQSFGAEGQAIWNAEAQKPGNLPDFVDLTAWGGPSQPPLPQGDIPGRGFPPANWNAATRAAVAAWEAANPGYKANGSPKGYYWTGWSPTPSQPIYGTPGGGGGGQFPTQTGLPPELPYPPYSDAPPGEGTIGGIPDMPVSYDPGNYFVTNSYAQKPVIPQASYGSMGPDTLYAMSGGPQFAPTSYSFQPSGVQAPIEQWNYAPTLSGSMQVYPPGVQSPYDTPDISARNAMPPSSAYNLYQYGGGGGMQSGTPAAAAAQPANAPGEIGQGYSGPLLPNQINAKNYANTYQYAKDLGWAAYEDAGWDKALAQETFERSLPKTGGPKFGSFAF